MLITIALALPTLWPLELQAETPPEANAQELVYYDWVDEAGQLRGGRAWAPIEQAETLPQVPFMPAVTIWQGSGGSNDNRVDLVFVGDGYQASELDDFEDHVDSQSAAFLNEEPFATYATYFNIHRVDVISVDSGVDNDPSQGINRNTAMNMRFWCNGIERLLCVSTSLASGFANMAPDRDYVIAIANSSKYGGAGYPQNNMATVSGGNGSASEVMIHEMGHALGNLADEYNYGGPSAWPGGEPNEANNSTRDAAAMAGQNTKWADWLGENQGAFDGLVSTFEGAHYSQTGIYRPTNNSLMRNLGRPFNLPSVEELIVQIHQHLEVIDDSSPTGAIYEGDETLFITPMQPVGHALDTRWLLNGTPIPGATSTTLDMSTLGLPIGTHNITAEVVDPTPWVRSATARANHLTDTRVFTVESSLVTNYCQASPNSAGSGAFMNSLGTTSVSANNFVVNANSAAVSQVGIFYYGTNATEAPFGDGYRCVAGSTYRLPILQTGFPFGDVTYPIDLSAPPQASGQISAGSTWFFQFWFRDPAAGGTGHNLSNGLEATFVP
ncbi:MAG: hypothetical protein ACI841_005362 [Planctomycetota bacterium]|jgi:hypothetical protein